MQAIRSLFSAFANLAAAINALAGVVDSATGKLRQQLALDEPAALPHGEVLDHAGADSGTPAMKRNGRKATA